MTKPHRKARKSLPAWTDLLQASREVLANWETGDLAQAVNRLREAVKSLEVLHPRHPGRSDKKKAG